MLGQAKDGVGAGPATRLGQLPHRPAGYSTSLRTPLALPFGAEKGVVSQQKRAERRRVFRPLVQLLLLLVSGCRRCLTQAPASHLHSLPARTPHTTTAAGLFVVCRPTSLTATLSILQPSPLAAARPSHPRIARIASQRPVYASSALASSQSSSITTTAAAAFKHISDSTTTVSHPR